MPRSWVSGLLLGLAPAWACSRVEPPGALEEAPAVLVVHAGNLGDGAKADGEADEERETEGIVALDVAGREAPGAEPEAGSRDDSLPFVPDGTKIGSIAWRTWIYTDIGPKRTRYGYLRAGAIVDALGPITENDGCQGGWYRINPRGFVCLGKGATLELDHEVIRQASVRPKRGQALPYVYAMSSESPPWLYFKLPRARDMREVEGTGIAQRVLQFRHRIESSELAFLLRDPAPPPEFLLGGASLTKPYGVARPLRHATHAGRASTDAGFALQGIFEWEQRIFGLTTEHDIIALDRTKLVNPSTFHGIRFEADEDLPAAFTKIRYAQEWSRRPDGQMTPSRVLGYREGIKLTGQRLSGGFLETKDAGWVVESTLELIRPRQSWPSVATGTRKWIDVSIRHQTLVAYEGRRPVYATLMSSGRGGTGDPETESATQRGTFMIHSKHVSSTMDGDEDKSDSFDLRDVPFVQYFHRGFALHGTYWHDDFGRMRSHGCINLSPIDAAWLFEWTDPPVPEEWHGAMNKDRGTAIYIHI